MTHSTKCLATIGLHCCTCFSTSPPPPPPCTLVPPLLPHPGTMDAHVQQPATGRCPARQTGDARMERVKATVCHFSLTLCFGGAERCPTRVCWAVLVAQCQATHGTTPRGRVAQAGAGQRGAGWQKVSWEPPVCAARHTRAERARRWQHLTAGHRGSSGGDGTQPLVEGVVLQPGGRRALCRQTDTGGAAKEQSCSTK